MGAGPPASHATGTPAGEPRGVPRPRPWWARPTVAVGIPVVVTIVHAIVVGRHYHVGSFDDDAGYILAGKALLAGQGLTGHLTSGATVIGAYPPGFAFLLVPLLAIWPHTFLPLRVLTTTSVAVLLPLTWWYLGRRRCPDPVRVGVMVLLALNVVLATFATMVMVEGPSLVAFVAMLVLVDRWDLTTRVWTPAGVGTMVTAAGLIWLKEANVGLVAGLILWLVWKRRVPKAIATAVAVGVLLLPAVIARLSTGVALAGSRYSQELGGYYSGGLSGRLLHVLPSSFAHYFSTALPDTLVPFGSPIPFHQPWTALGQVLSWQVPLFTVIGFVLWIRRHRDASVFVVPVYVAETLLWPYINERRVILVLPVLVAWYALGVWTSGRWLVVAARRWKGAATARGALSAYAALAVAVVVLPLLAQFNRDYLLASGQDTSQPIGSRYAQILTRLGPSHTIVETDYLSTTALISGHRTANGAFLAVNGAVARDPHGCSTAIVERTIAADRAGYLLLGAFNHPGVLNSPCILHQATTKPWAVRLLRTHRDRASVFELIGPGTAHPDLRDLTSGARVTTSGPTGRPPIAPSFRSDVAGTALSTTTDAQGQATMTWTWSKATAVTQVSVGQAGAEDRTTGVAVELRSVDGSWRTVASSTRRLGDERGAAPFLLRELPPQTIATAMRIVVTGTGQAVASDVHALGPGGGSLR